MSDTEHQEVLDRLLRELDAQANRMAFREVWPWPSPEKERRIITAIRWLQEQANDAPAP